jgi:TRAP-type mannitol/chloroaromatic compound transport system substrate-binding protein
VAKYVVVPGVHQPTAPFELIINKDAWAKLSDRQKEAVQDAAKLTTLQSWLTIGVEDAKALDFYREQGNEIIHLSKEVQIEARKIALKWADEQSADNDWFARVWDNQKQFMKLWKRGQGTRDVVPLTEVMD